MEDSSFSPSSPTYPDAEQLTVSGSTCDCYRVRLYGKLHFLKRLKPEFQTNPRYTAALQKEFETGYQLDHPHLVRYVSFSEYEILMEYVDGEPLSQFTSSHPDYFKSRQNTNRFLLQLLSVLEYLHSHQIIHLDLKPDNIIMTHVGNDVKLVDLGYCHTDTYTDTMGRTDKYAAPEQFDDSGVDVRTDVYALGKILETLPVPSIYNKVISKCTKTDRSERYQSVGDVRRHLPRLATFKYTSLVVLGCILIGVLTIMLLNGQQTPSMPTDEGGPTTIVKDTTTNPNLPEIPKREPPVDQHKQQYSQLNSEIPSLIAPIFQETIGTYNIENHGGDLDTWMPIHRLYVDRINALTMKMKYRFPTLDEMEINRMLWDYAQPPLDKIVSEIMRLRQQPDSIG